MTDLCPTCEIDKEETVGVSGVTLWSLCHDEDGNCQVVDALEIPMRP